MPAARIFVAAACLLLGIGLPAQASGHVPNIASFHLEEHEGAWELTAQLSTARLHRALEHRHPGRDLSEADVGEYEALLETMLREGIRIRYDHTEVALGDATVALAPHASEIHFAVPWLPADTHKVAAYIDVLDYDGEQQNVFRVMGGGARKHVVLAARNGFRGDVVLQVTSGEPPRQTGAREEGFATEEPGAGAFWVGWVGWVTSLLLAAGWMLRRNALSGPNRLRAHKG